MAYGSRGKLAPTPTPAPRHLPTRAVLLEDDFMDLYTDRSEGAAGLFLAGWLHRAMYSKIEPIKKVARMIRNRLDGVLVWARWCSAPRGAL